MKTIVVLPSFERDLKKLPAADQRRVVETLEQFNHFVATGEFSHGFGIKKINHDKYEFRVDIRLRVVFKQQQSDIYLVLVGNHEEVRRYLKHYRHK